MSAWDQTVDISKEQALEHARNFIGGRWNKVSEDEIELSPLGNGYSARLYLLEDKSGNDNEDKKVCGHKILVRLLGGKLLDDPTMQTFKHSPAIEAIYMFKLGQLGLGPKLLGVFEGGRLEEYIPSHTLSTEDLQDKEIRMQIVRKIARIHCLAKDFPINKIPREHFKLMTSYYEEFDCDAGREEFIRYCKVAEIEPDWALNHDWRAERDWLQSLEPKMTTRLVWSLVDLNKLNCLIRDEPDSFGERVTLIDYELGCITHRANDLGAHFNGYPMDINAPGWRSGLPFPSEEMRREYCEEYLRETKKYKDQLGYEFDENGLDSVDQLMMEADYCGLLATQVFAAFMLKPKVPDSPLWIPFVAKNFLSILKYMFECYQERKAQFRAKYNL